MDTLKKLRTAVIGTGFWGKNQARVLSQLDVAELVCVCDMNEVSAKSVGAEFQVPYSTHLDEVLSRKDIDAGNGLHPYHNPQANRNTGFVGGEACPR